MGKETTAVVVAVPGLHMAAVAAAVLGLLVLTVLAVLVVTAGPVSLPLSPEALSFTLAVAVAVLMKIAA